MLSYKIAIRLWWGPFRRVFEAIMRRTLQESSTIKTGPLKGNHFQGGLAQIIGIYEPTIQQTITQYLAPGNVFYDIGANNGFFSLLGSKLTGTNGLIFSFEPMPESAEKIRSMIKHNQLQNCELIECAVSNTTKKVKLHFSDNLSTPTLLGSEYKQSIVVESITLDNFIEKNPHPDLIKVDVEGAEKSVLVGARKLLAEDNNPPKWIIEIHSAESDQEVSKILKEFQYKIDNIAHIQQPKNYPRHIMAIKRA